MADTKATDTPPSKKVVSDDDDDDDDARCRVCGDTSAYGPLLDSICGCRGSMSSIHQSCLELWLSRCAVYTRCPTCKADFTVDLSLHYERPSYMKLAPIYLAETVLHAVPVMLSAFLTALFLSRVLAALVAGSDVGGRGPPYTTTSALALVILYSVEALLLGFTVSSQPYIRVCSDLWYSLCTTRPQPRYVRGSTTDIALSTFIIQRLEVYIAVTGVAIAPMYVGCRMSYIFMLTLSTTPAQLARLAIGNGTRLLLTMSLFASLALSLWIVYRTWYPILSPSFQAIRAYVYNLISIGISTTLSLVLLSLIGPRVHGDWDGIYQSVFTVQPMTSNSTGASPRIPLATDAYDSDDFGLLDYAELFICLVLFALSLDWHNLMATLTPDDDELRTREAIDNEGRSLFFPMAGRPRNPHSWTDEADFLWALSHIPYYTLLTVPCLGALFLALTSRKALAFIFLLVLWTRGSLLSRLSQHFEALTLGNSQRLVRVGAMR